MGMLDNANAHFYSGMLSGGSPAGPLWYALPENSLVYSHSYELNMTGARRQRGEEAYRMVDNGQMSFRSFRMQDMYGQSQPPYAHGCCLDEDCGAGRTCGCDCKGDASQTTTARQMCG